MYIKQCYEKIYRVKRYYTYTYIKNIYVYTYVLYVSTIYVCIQNVQTLDKNHRWSEARIISGTSE